MPEAITDILKSTKPLQAPIMPAEQPAPTQFVQRDPLVEAKARQRLISRLQMSLELSQVLDCFFHESQYWLQFEGLEYRHQDSDNIKIGDCQRHSFDYQLNCENQTLGSLIFYSAKRMGEMQLSLLESLISLLLYPLKNALTYEQALAAAFVDPLTGIGNRASLDRNLHRELQMAHRHGDELSILLLDLDHFKQINDNHGHSTGDEILRQVAQLLEYTCRETDRVFRFGGEEFLVLLPKTHHCGARVIAERLRQAVHSIKLELKHATIEPTVSIGIAKLKDSDKVSELFERADQALYSAKSGGRNRVVLAD